jgi:hypothetical protein
MPDVPRRSAGDDHGETLRAGMRTRVLGVRGARAGRLVFAAPIDANRWIAVAAGDDPDDGLAWVEDPRARAVLCSHCTTFGAPWEALAADPVQVMRAQHRAVTTDLALRLGVSGPGRRTRRTTVGRRDRRRLAALSETMRQSHRPRLDRLRRRP